MIFRLNYEDAVTKELINLFNGGGNVLVGAEAIQSVIKSDLNIKEGMEIAISNNDEADPYSYKQCEIHTIQVAYIKNILEDGCINQYVYVNIVGFVYNWYDYVLIQPNAWFIEDIENEDFEEPVSTQEVINRVKNMYKEQRAKDLMKTE